MKSEVPQLGRASVKELFPGEWWWTLTLFDGTERGSLYAWGWNEDRREANRQAREAGMRLGRELGYL